MRLQLDAHVRRVGDGRVLLGGSPTRLLRLGGAGVALLDSWLSGDPVGPEPSARAFARRLLDAEIVHPAVEPGISSKTEVTLVVPVRDNPDGLARLLAATTEIRDRVIVDDASRAPLDDATLRHDRQRGPAAARNTGWRCTTTPLIAFLDSDTIPDPDWLDRILPLFDDPEVAAVAPRVVSLATGPVGHYEVRRSALDMGREPARVRPDSRVRYLPAAALVIRADALRAVDGFDEDLRFGEDVDLIWRLIAAGNTVRYQPLSLVRHDPRGTLRGFLRQRFDYGTSAAPLALRHPGLLAAAHLTPVSGAQCALALLGHPVAATLPSVLTAARLTRRLHGRGVPLPTAAATATSGQLGMVRQLAEALRRAWWPLALCSRRGRRLLSLACAAAAIESAYENSDAALRLADDFAYGLGVWAGCLRHRTLVPLVPRLHRSRKGTGL